MRIQVRKLRETMLLLETVIPKKPRFPAFGRILFKDGKAVAYSPEMTAIVELREASEPVLLSLGLLNFLRHIPGETIAEITPRDQKSQTVVICGKSKSTVPWIDPESFPATPDIPELDLHIDGDRLMVSIMMASLYVPIRDKSRIALNGVSVLIGPERSFVAAGDGFRMFFKDIPLRADERAWIIPDEVISTLNKFWLKTRQPDPPEIDALLTQVMLSKRIMRVGTAGEEDRMLFAQFGKTTLAIPLVAGTPPPWMNLVPSEFKSTLKIAAQDLYRAVEQVANTAIDNSNIVRLEWGKEALRISAQSEDQFAEASVKIALEGEEGHIAFNLRYLSDYLKNRQGFIEMNVSAPQSPGLFLDGVCSVVIMPMNVKWAGDEPENPPEEPPADTPETTPPPDDAAAPAETPAPQEKEKKPKWPRKKKGAEDAGAEKEKPSRKKITSEKVS
ncbi:MAG: DNA polymerase III subunit beta [Patescibacteria group bacterium]